MTVREFLESIIKYRRITVFFVALALVLCTMNSLSSSNTTAKIIIEYTSSKAKDGISENGKEINPFEIASAAVIRRATDQLNVPNANIEQIRRHLTVEPIVPTVEKEKYASWIEGFTDYNNTEEKKAHPTFYVVSFTSSRGEDFTKSMLNAIMDVYRDFYIEKYTYNSDIINIDPNTAQEYDYYETVDLVNERIEANVKYLHNIIANSEDYRSIRTGYSINDLISMFERLQKRETAIAEQKILTYGASRNPEISRVTFDNVILQAQKDCEIAKSKEETNRKLMTDYSENNRKSISSQNRAQEGSSGQVKGDVQQDRTYVHDKTTYDQLTLDFVNYKTDYMRKLIDIEKYQDVNNKISEGHPTVEQITEVESLVNDVCIKFREIYSQTLETLHDYNKFKSSGSIAAISGVIVQKSGNTLFNYLVGIVLALGAGVTISVLKAIVISMKKKEKEQCL